jgi:hypothetical protein
MNQETRFDSPALEIRRKAQQILLEEIQTEMKTFLQNYADTYVHKYGSLDNIPPNAYISWDDIEGPEIVEIFINKLVEVCGHLVDETDKRGCMVLAKQTELFIEHVVYIHGVSNISYYTLDFVTRQWKQHVCDCEAMTRLLHYLQTNKLELPSIPEGPHYPF